MKTTLSLAFALCWIALPALAQTPPSDLTNAPFHNQPMVSFETQLASPTQGAVTLLNSFYVEPQQAAAFQAQWEKIAIYMRAQPGFISTRLHRATGGSPLWVNIAVWRSLSDFQAALTKAEFVAMAKTIEAKSFRHLYQPVE